MENNASFDYDILRDIHGSIEYVFQNTKIPFREYCVISEITEKSTPTFMITLSMSHFRAKNMKEMSVIMESKLKNYFGCTIGFSVDKNVFKIHMREEYKKQLSKKSMQR